MERVSESLWDDAHILCDLTHLSHYDSGDLMLRD